MRLFEVDAGSGREVLSVLKGLANTPGPDGQEATSVLPFKVILNVLRPFSLGIATPDGLVAFKNSIDPQGSVIRDIDDQGNITLNTNTQDPTDNAGEAPPPKAGSGGPNVDSMASHNSKNFAK